MTDSTPRSEFPDADDVDALWRDLQSNLATYLSTMVDPTEQDHLIVELADLRHCPSTTPYVQFAGMDGGRMLRAEITGSHYLDPSHQLDDEAELILRALGWLGNDESEPNWFTERPLAEVTDLARDAVVALRHLFGIVHPQLLTHQAWGPAAIGVELLGLADTEDVPKEGTTAPRERPLLGTAQEPTIFSPADRDELVALVGEVLEEQCGECLNSDADGDFALLRNDHLVWVHIPEESPAVEVITRVAQDVHSRRTAAVEIGLLNRDYRWMKWVLTEREIWQTLFLPGRPFVPAHLIILLGQFLKVLDETRDELAYRTGTRTN